MDVDEMDIDLGTDANIEALEAEAIYTVRRLSELTGSIKLM